MCGNIDIWYLGRSLVTGGEWRKSHSGLTLPGPSQSAVVLAEIYPLVAPSSKRHRGRWQPWPSPVSSPPLLVSLCGAPPCVSVTPRRLAKQTLVPRVINLLTLIRYLLISIWCVKRRETFAWWCGWAVVVSAGRIPLPLLPRWLTAEWRGLR